MEEETIFHKIIKGEIPADIVYQDEQLIAIKDIQPASPLHLLIISRKTIPRLAQVAESDKELLGHMMYIAARLAEESGVAQDGYRLVMNNGSAGGQTVFQLHLHLLGGRDFSWPPG